MKTLITNIQKDVDRLKRQSETLKCSRSLAKAETKVKDPLLEPKTLTGEMKEKTDYVIHAEQQRLQAMKHMMSHMIPENMSYEDLEELKVICLPYETLNFDRKPTNEN